ncbi:hypothetical protein NDU88_000034 [Pleurodeles waltl]|uniref:Uncharacterized protein n=1 Tax=Pleurodeles waltl TaxID=8319 RepID=A0AAV7KM05_PLEWA|nr:hypothetical protein NDU88_000034 [Pleurodeles waltl]
MVRALSKHEGTVGNEKRYVLTELRPESQKRLLLFLHDPGDIRCHSDLMILQQEWTLRPCLQKYLPGLVMTEKTRDDRARSPQGDGTRRADPVHSLELEQRQKGQSGNLWEQALKECFDISAFLSLSDMPKKQMLSLRLLSSRSMSFSRRVRNSASCSGSIPTWSSTFVRS